MYITEFEGFYNWLMTQRADGNWAMFSTYIDNRIGIERDLVMTLLGSLSRENHECINSLIEAKARINLLEEIRDLPSLGVEYIAKSAGVAES